MVQSRAFQGNVIIFNVIFVVQFFYTTQSEKMQYLKQET